MPEAADAIETATEAPLTHPEEIRLQSEFRVGERWAARAMVRLTPAGLVCLGIMVATILLSTAAVVRAARRI